MTNDSYKGTCVESERKKPQHRFFYFQIAHKY